MPYRTREHAPQHGSERSVQPLRHTFILKESAFATFPAIGLTVFNPQRFREFESSTVDRGLPGQKLRNPNSVENAAPLFAGAETRRNSCQAHGVVCKATGDLYGPGTNVQNASNFRKRHSPGGVRVL